MQSATGADMSSQSDTSRRDSYQCSQCSKGYKRREHLQRHCAAVHTNLKPHTCTTCGRSFQRADVMKRHQRVCEAKASGMHLAATKKRACDFCVRQKKACSNTQPCLNCHSRSIECRYTFLAEGHQCMPATEQCDHCDVDSHSAADHDGNSYADGTAEIPPQGSLFTPLQAGGIPLPPYDGSWTDIAGILAAQPQYLLDPTMNLDPSLPSDNASWATFFNFQHVTSVIGGSPDQFINMEDLESKTSLCRFKFLGNFTSQTGLVESFECGSDELREQILASFLDRQFDELAGQSPPDTLFTTRIAADEGDAASLPDVYSYGGGLPKPSMLQTHQVVSRIRAVTQCKARNSPIMPDWSPTIEQECFQFFSPQNVSRLVNVYWAIWHPNVNILHRPTFDVSTVKPALLAAMVTIAACVSPDCSDKEQAKTWFNCVEEVVFTDEDLCSEPLYTLENDVPIPALQAQKVQAIQAAYIVCLYQNWEGGDAAKRQIRRFRFGTMVSVIRGLGIAFAKHSIPDTHTGNAFDWQTFSLREEFIRVVLWISLLDHAFGIFNNLPSRLVIKEMRSHFAYPESCFLAPTAQACESEVRKWVASSPARAGLNVCNTTVMLCKGTLSRPELETLANLGPLNLFVIVSAFHGLIFQHRNAMVGGGQLEAVRRGLDNWYAMWEIYSAKFSTLPPHVIVSDSGITVDNAWQRVGFMRHSPEYWLLARLLVDRQEYQDSLEDDASSGEVPDFSAALAGETTLSSPSLSKFDQTSMRQVNDVISEFDKVHIAS